MTTKKSEKSEKPQKPASAQETKKVISEDVEVFFRDVWGKVVEYASLGAEEASKVSTTAKTKVDIETLKFKKGKMVKILGDRYLEACEKDKNLAVDGTKETLKQIRAIDREIKALEKGLTPKKSKAKAKKKPAAKKAPAKKTPAKKAPAKKAAVKKTGTKATKPKKGASSKAKPAAKKAAPKKK